MKSKLLFLALISFFAANAQYTGATPWENCYGKNASCQTYVENGYYVGMLNNRS